MTWQLMWCNVRAASLNATFQLLVIYSLIFDINKNTKKLKKKKGSHININRA